MFKHLVITRFNLINSEWQQDREGKPLCDDEWMDHRMQLFEGVCYPSLRGQTCQNFSWIVCFDVTTKDKYRTRIDELAKEWDNFKPIYIAFNDFPVAALKYYGDDEYLITTRVDNDDALHKDAVGAVQKHFAQQDFEFANFNKGLNYDGHRVYLREEDCGPFVSLIEKVSGDPKTVWIDEHKNLSKQGSVTQLKEFPYWLRIIHDRNVANRSHFTAPTLLDHIRRKIKQLLGMELSLAQIASDYNIDVQKCQSTGLFR